MILGTGGYRSVIDCRRVLNPDGTYVFVGGSNARLCQAMLLGPVLSMIDERSVGSPTAAPDRDDLIDVRDLIEAGEPTFETRGQYGHMTKDGSFFDRMFNRPAGLPGRIGAMLMTRMNGNVAADTLDWMSVEQTDAILEIGFGPGIGIEHAADLASDGYVAGVDVSEMMVDRARRRNATAIETGLVDLRSGSVEQLPFDSETFDVAFSINSVHAWPDQPAGASEIYRVLEPGGRVALVLTKHAGQPDEPLENLLRTAGFERIRHPSRFDGDAVLGSKPGSS